MEAKDSLVTILKALVELHEPVPRQLLSDFLLGKETPELDRVQWFEKEMFGCGDNHSEEYWANLLDAALDANFLKNKPAKSSNLVLTPAGKKFLRKPTSFPVGEDNELSDITPDSGLESLVQSALEEKLPAELTASPKTKQQIKLIHAIDRKIALDDFAESESLGFDEVLDDLENLIHQGRALDITYFTDEVMGAECVDELLDYFCQSSTDSLEEAMREYGDVYNIEEIRLARIVFRVQKMKNNAPDPERKK